MYTSTCYIHPCSGSAEVRRHNPWLPRDRHGHVQPHRHSKPHQPRCLTGGFPGGLHSHRRGLATLDRRPSAPLAPTLDSYIGSSLPRRAWSQLRPLLSTESVSRSPPGAFEVFATPCHSDVGAPLWRNPVAIDSALTIGAVSGSEPVRNRDPVSARTTLYALLGMPDARTYRPGPTGLMNSKSSRRPAAETSQW